MQKHIGLIALSSDGAIEQDLEQILPPTCSLQVHRIIYDEPITVESLERLLSKLDGATKKFSESDNLPKIIGFACTSGSVAIGFKSIEKTVQNALPQDNSATPVINPMMAGIEALEKLGVKKISLLTPYPKAVSEMVKNFFEDHDYKVSSHRFLDKEFDKDIYEITPEQIANEAFKCVDPSSEALFISCTTLQAVEAIPLVEKQCQIPVITSNQALGYSFLNYLREKTSSGPGRLFSSS